MLAQALNLADSVDRRERRSSLEPWVEKEKAEARTLRERIRKEREEKQDIGEEKDKSEGTQTVLHEDVTH